MQTISRGKKAGTIALTFDDGITRNIPRLLDILDMEKAKATFFIIGQSLKIKANLDIAKEIHKRGHILANHTWTHPQITKIPVADLEKELRDTEKALEDIRGDAGKNRFFRPPYGATNDAINEILIKLGYTVFLWNIDTNDWDTKRSKEVLLDVYKKLFAQANPEKHSFISLQHDRRRDTVELVPDLLKLARGKGFKIVSLEELLS